mmetsp:Transcript_13460/g.43935  ORF Transcript_13460/g.43935 Transcript_13460/m.43935 type:complete len:228 (+) Transcript_13460:281-964(+)
MQRRGQGRRRIRASLRQASASCRNGAVKGDAEIAAAARLRRLPDLRAPDSPRRVKNTQSPPRPRADLRRHRTGLVAGSQQHANKAQVVQLAPFARGITLPRRAAFVGRDLLVGHLVDVLLERQRALLPHRCVGRLDRRQRLNRIGARLQQEGGSARVGRNDSNAPPPVFPLLSQLLVAVELQVLPLLQIAEPNRGETVAGQFGVVESNVVVQDIHVAEADTTQPGAA